MMEAFLATESIHLGESSAECTELCRILAMAWNQRERPCQCRATLDKALAMAARVKKSLSEVEVTVAKAEARVTMA